MVELLTIIAIEKGLELFGAGATFGIATFLGFKDR